MQYRTFRRILDRHRRSFFKQVDGNLSSDQSIKGKDTSKCPLYKALLQNVNRNVYLSNVIQRRIRRIENVLQWSPTFLIYTV